MKVSVTGTRDGMTDDQRVAFASLITSLPRIEEFHHGKCIGVDIQAARLARLLRDAKPDAVGAIVAHPGMNNGALEADDPHSDRAEPPRTNFARNRALVDLLGDDDLLVVVPRSDSIVPPGGTAYTYEYARKKGKNILVLLPGGGAGREGDSLDG